MIETLVVLGLLALLVVYVIGIYNRLVKLRVRVGEAWSDIDVQMKRRYNLIPNLVETVKGYAGHEKETFERVVAARSAAVSQHRTARRRSCLRKSASPDATWGLAPSFRELSAKAAPRSFFSPAAA